MSCSRVLFLVTLVLSSNIVPSLQNYEDNEVEVEEVNPFAEVAAQILKEKNGANIASMISGFMQSGGAQNLISDAISNIGAENAGNLLQGIGSIISSMNGEGNGGGGGGGGGGFDPTVLNAVLGMMKDSQEAPKQKKAKGNQNDFDLGDILSMASSFFGDQSGGLNVLPMIMNTVAAFTGPEAQRREKSHAGHSSMLPPFLEKLHVLFDHFIHSELGRNIINMIGAEKTFRSFLDDNGKFSYQKFGEMMENHSFRKHWLSVVTSRVAGFVSYIADPKIQKKYVTGFVNVANSLLRSYGFPKSAIIDVNRPTETISGFINYAVKKFLGTKVSSKQYVKPVVDYFQEVISLADKKGIFQDNERSKELSDKLADTINMEIIEPIVRVNRAYRFATNVPKCDRYVFCLVNRPDQNEVLSIPGLKSLLSKGSSFIASWFLNTGTPFWTLYNDITSGDNCKDLYSSKCNDFHIEEEKVTTEYVHTEL